MTKPTTITFGKGYERLQEIADEVNQAEIPVDVLGDRFAEGKGLERALSDYLAGEKARIEQIEKGDEIQAFRVVAEGGEEKEDKEPAEGGIEETLPF